MPLQLDVMIMVAVVHYTGSKVTHPFSWAKRSVVLGKFLTFSSFIPLGTHTPSFMKVQIVKKC